MTTSNNAASRIALLTSPAFLGHDTGAHPENPGRMAAVLAALEQHDLTRNRPVVPFRHAGMAALERVHDLAWLDTVEAMSLDGGGLVDMQTIVRPDSWDVVLLAAGAVTTAVDAVFDGFAPGAFVLARPPGHHATPSRGMGFCLLNTVAIGTAHARARGVERVAIIDWDVHHGNGTQDCFYDDDRVLFVSLHQHPLYPGTGRASERGVGAGMGFTLNIPLPPGSDGAVYLQAFDQLVAPAVRSFAPGLIMISAGFDAHAADPLANMRLNTAAFGALTSRTKDLADQLCNGRLVAVLEGGYDPNALARGVVATIRALDGEPPVSDVTTITGERS